MAKVFNSVLFSQSIRERRADRSLRDVVPEIRGISVSTLSRIENGHKPDVDTFVAACEWMNASLDSFLAEEGEPKTGLSQSIGMAISLEEEQELLKYLRFLRFEKEEAPVEVKMVYPSLSLGPFGQIID